jgi:ABC-2 type transport system permease protein
VQLYSLLVFTLWLAPVYCWLLFISVWAKRAPFLWAVLPPLAIGVFETIAFRTSYFASWVGKRLFGFASGAFDLKDSSGVAIDPHFIPLAHLAPGRFLSSATLWLGLIVAAALLAAAVRLRRHREPI